MLFESIKTVIVFFHYSYVFADPMILARRNVFSLVQCGLRLDRSVVTQEDDRDGGSQDDV